MAHGRVKFPPPSFPGGLLLFAVWCVTHKANGVNPPCVNANHKKVRLLFTHMDGGSAEKERAFRVTPIGQFFVKKEATAALALRGAGRRNNHMGACLKDCGFRVTHLLQPGNMTLLAVHLSADQVKGTSMTKRLCVEGCSSDSDTVVTTRALSRRLTRKLAGTRVEIC